MKMDAKIEMLQRAQAGAGLASNPQPLARTSLAEDSDETEGEDVSEDDTEDVRVK